MKKEIAAWVWNPANSLFKQKKNGEGDRTYYVLRLCRKMRVI